ncbi:hypothetical protein N7451_012369 [Penicillium sp. IBT 35674x]|nr:hypothetical protein N7451_012369 [Penicillium sp. IBT 35674x]
MANIPHKRTRQNKGTSLERFSLPGHPYKMRSTSMTKKEQKRVLGHSRRLTENITGVGKTSSPRQTSHITLRLRQQQCQDPESLWWTSLGTLDQDKDEEMQDDAVSKEAIRQAWLQRLSPRASHQLSPVKPKEARKRQRNCQV